MKELILEIMKIALEKNQENKNTIFVNFSGHVNALHIYVYKSGWESGLDADYQKNVYINIDEDCVKSLTEILDYLKGLEV